METKIEISKSQLDKLFFVLDYVMENEAHHFEEYCDNGGKKEDHIYYRAANMAAQLEEKFWHY